MTISRIALLAGLGMLAMTLPATAAPTASGSTDVRIAKPDPMQLAQAVNRTRQINEERGGSASTRPEVASASGQCRKCRVPVNTIAMPWSSAAVITS